MRTDTDRFEFAPPPTPGLMRSFGLAVLAHAFLLAALTLGVQWKRDDVTLTAEAEIWSAVPQQAAPKLEEPPEEPTPPPAQPTVRPEPVPPRPVPPPIPKIQPPEPPEVDIALEREKARLKKIKEQKQAQDKLALEQRRDEKLRLDKLKQEQIKQDQLKQDKQDKALAERKRVQDQRAQDKRELEKRELDKREKDKAVALEKKKSEQEAQRKEDAAKTQAEAKQLEAQRQTNLQRMAGLAGATGAPGSTGAALQSSGPSASYAGRIRASIKPNIVFNDDITGNPVAEVEVRTSPDGTIISRKLTTPSGVASWDDAVLKAIDKTGKLPKDTDGRVPSTLEIRFRPKD